MVYCVVGVGRRSSSLYTHHGWDIVKGECAPVKLGMKFPILWVTADHDPAKWSIEVSNSRLLSNVGNVCH